MTIPSGPILNPIKISVGSIGTLSALCLALDISPDDLEKALNLPLEERYQRRSIPKKDGSSRIVHNPHYLIRKIQRRINRRIFSNHNVICWPDHVFGSIPNSDDWSSASAAKDYVNCARQHCGAKSILSVDIREFFDNIDRDLVFKIYRGFLKCSDEVSKALTDISCMGSHVVQGALTSSYLATLCLFETEGALVNKLKQKGLVYTRLVDDITISSKICNYDFSYALKLTENMVCDVGLPLNSGKTRIQYASMLPLVVHGLRVDFDQPRLMPLEPKRIRASVKNLELLAASPGYRASRAYRKDFNRCMGRVNKLKRVGHSQYDHLIKRIKAILPLPSHKDIERAEKQIQRLTIDYKKQNYKDSYWFYKRYYVASERLAILKRSFPKKAQELRDILSPMRPTVKHE